MSDDLYALLSDGDVGEPGTLEMIQQTLDQHRAEILAAGLDLPIIVRLVPVDPGVPSPPVPRPDPGRREF